MHTRFHPFVSVFILFGLLVVLISCAGGGGADDGEQIEIVTVQRGSLTVNVTAIGSVSPRAEVTLSFGTAGEVHQVLVQAGARAKTGQALARLETSDLALQVRSAEAALTAAQARSDQLEAGAQLEEIAIAQANLDAAHAQLAGAQANLRELSSGPDEQEIAAAEANLNAAEASLWLARIQRNQILDAPSAAEIAAAEAQLASALVEQKIARDTHDQTLQCQTVRLSDGTKQEICPALGTLEEQSRFRLQAADQAVAAAQAQLDLLLAGATSDQIDTANANVAAAQAQRDAAQAQLDLLRSGASTEQLKAAQANVDALQAQRDAAQAQLDLLLSGATAADKATTQSSVAQAQVTLDRARLALEKATLRAPVDGLVVRVDVEPGELIAPQMPVITLLDDTRFKIKVDVDEADIGWVDVNQEVQLTLDAFPAAKLIGRVVAIAPLATLETGVVSYQVTIEIDPIDLPLRSGMTVSADIVIDQRQDILLVPNRAIWIDADTGQPFVEKTVDGEYVGAIIEQGLANEEVSEVLSGLVEGDQLVVRSSSIRDRFRDMMTRSMTGE
jgi:HlyD family secretion protein